MPCAEQVEHLRADAEVAGVGGKTELQVRLDGVRAAVLEVVGADLVQQADAAPFLPEVHEDAAALGGDGLHGGVALRAAVAAQRVEAVPGEAFAVHAHEQGLGGDVAHDERDVFRAAEGVLEADEAELAVLGGQTGFRHELHEGIMFHAVGDKGLDAADLQAVPLAEREEVREAAHLAVVAHDLADHADRRKAREPGEVAAGLGVSGAAQHPAGPRDEREDVAGAAEVGRFRRVVHQGGDGGGAVEGADAGGVAHVIHADGEGRAVRVGAAAHHGRQVQCAGAVRREGHADQAASLARHEVHPLGRRRGGGHQEVALVLAVLVVYQNHGPPGAQFRQQLGDGGQGHTVTSCSGVQSRIRISRSTYLAI